MIQQTYLFGYAGKRKTWAEMDKDIHWTKIHPEARRRYKAIMIDCPYDLGIGSGFRTYEEQLWSHKNSGGTDPGNSYHEATDPFGYSFAMDFLAYQPAIGWAHANAHRYGLYHFGKGPNGKDVNGDIPHFQLVELPVARSQYRPNVHTLRYFPLPGASPHYYSPWPTPSLSPSVVGEAVRQLQRELTNWNKNPGPIDGRYGPRTAAAVEAGQREVGANGFDPGPFDGIYGARTRAAFDAYYQSRGWGVR